MRHLYAGLMACAALGACAQAPLPTVVPAVKPAEAAKVAAIPDAEPEVTQQVSRLLGRAGQGLFTTEQLTDSARTVLTIDQMRTISGTLAPCGTTPALELLRRTTRGEDREYVYRAPCGGNALLVAIDFNKAGKINKLEVQLESMQ